MRYSSPQTNIRRSRYGLPVLGGVVVIVLLFTALLPGQARTNGNEPATAKEDSVQAKHPGKNPVSVKALERLQANSRAKWNIQWDRETGLPGIGGGQFGRYSGTIEEIALAIANDYKDFFLGIADSQALVQYSFEVDETDDARLFKAVKLKQKYRGITVFKAQLVVWISDDVGLNRVMNGLAPVDLADVTPTLFIPDIEKIIRQTFDPLPVGEHDGQMELVIYPSSPPRLAWYAYRHIDRIPWLFWIDAHTGEIIRSTSLRIEETRLQSPKPEKTVDSANQRNDSSLRPLHSPQPMRLLPDVEKRRLDTLPPTPEPERQIYRQPPDSAKEPKRQSVAEPAWESWFYDVNFLPGFDAVANDFNQGQILEELFLMQAVYKSNHTVIQTGSGNTNMTDVNSWHQFN